MKATIYLEDHKSVAHYTLETLNGYSFQELFDFYAVEIPDELVARHKVAQKELRECDRLLLPYYDEAVRKHTQFPITRLVKELGLTFDKLKEKQ